MSLSRNTIIPDHCQNRTDGKKLFGITPEMWICAVIISVTIGVYWQVHDHGFIHYDDDIYITDNEYVQKGFSLDTILWAFTDTRSGNIHPLTWYSHMLDYQLFGGDAGKHHLVSVLFHVINSILVFLVFRRMTGRLWASAFVSAMFALHPLHVESVAWASERKDVLSTLFFLLTIRFYVQYTKNTRKKYFIAALFLFFLGLLAKPMLVTLPFVLLLLDYWPLRRIPGYFFKEDSANETHSLPALRSLVIEKIPFFALSVFWSLVTFAVQQQQGAVKSLDAFPFHVRVANAIVAYISYIGKTLVPTRLAVLYPHPGMPKFSVVVFSSVALLMVFWVGFKWRKERPWFMTGWLWYAGTLVPVIGIIQVGHHSLADRYTYIPLIGISIILAWGSAELAKKWNLSPKVLGIAGFSLILFFSAFTYRQLGYWTDSITLFTRTIEITDKNYRIHYNLGNALSEKGQNEEATAHYLQAIRINPEYAPAYINLANALGNQGKYEAAIPFYHEAISIDPDSAEAFRNLGLVMSFQGKMEEAIQYLQKAILKNPDWAEAHNDLGYLLLKAGREKEGLAHFLEEIRIQPDTDFHSFYTIARIYGKNGNPDEAIRWLKSAVERGFNKWAFLQKDPFLESVKDTSYYQALVNRNRDSSRRSKALDANPEMEIRFEE